jgi:hypothetical protein
MTAMGFLFCELVFLEMKKLIIVHNRNAGTSHWHLAAHMLSVRIKVGACAYGIQYFQ